MITIIRTQEPTCLTTLKSQQGTTYDNLRGNCRKTVTTQLSSDQRDLCAYCQRKFTSTVFIEHYHPQSTVPSK